MMETQFLSSDIISSLPQDIIEAILSLMPIRDALRTSVLSKKWRYYWMTMPKLVFDHNLVRAKSGFQLKYNLVNAIFHVLLIHRGPRTLKFELDVNKLGLKTEFHQIILSLSSKTNVKDLSIYNTSDTLYKLPTSFFLIQGLESLELINCEFELPVTFNGFNKLRNMHFKNVKVSAKVLQHLLLNCPLLEEIILGVHITFYETPSFEDIILKKYLLMQGGYEKEYVEENSFKFVQLFECVPLLHTLDISKNYMKYLVAGSMPNKLPNSLHLKYVSLDLCLREHDVISSALCIIRSSPHLEELFFLMYDNDKLPTQESCIKFVDLQDDMSLTLDRLTYLAIAGFSNNSLEMEFVKLIMAKSPVLKIARIELKDNVTVDEELKILRDMIYLPFPRASPLAKLTVERPKTNCQS